MACLLTICSRQDDTRGHRTPPDDIGRHVEPGSVRVASNLRIRWPRGRGSSSLPSRTALTSGNAVSSSRKDTAPWILAHGSLNARTGAGHRIGRADRWTPSDDRVEAGVGLHL